METLKKLIEENPGLFRVLSIAIGLLVGYLVFISSWVFDLNRPVQLLLIVCSYFMVSVDEILCFVHIVEEELEW